MAKENQRELIFGVDNATPSRISGNRVIELPAGKTVWFDLSSGGHWYGHGFNHNQPYPLEKGEIINEAFAANNTQSPIWICSAGFVIFAETNEMLAVHINAGKNGRLEIRCDGGAIKLRVFCDETLPAAHRRLMARLGWPNEINDASLFGDVFFTTWTQYPRCISQQRVLDMAAGIRSNNYPCSSITIDDRWESAFGTLKFSADFPDPKAMVSQLHEMGLRAILWVTPFVDVNSPNFDQLAREGVLVGRKGGSSAATLKWWGGEAGLIDVTGPVGRNWLHNQLVRLRSEIGVDGFKIDGGDPKYMPPLDQCRWANDISPCDYIDKLLAVFEEVSPGLCKDRTVWLSQSRKILWHVGGKDTHWGINNGLKALVTLSLHMALLGYDILIPDMIPGRVQTLDSSHPLATDELMVRWTEVSAFMPMMQFSYLPWNYACETAEIVRRYADVHKSLEVYSFTCARKRTSPLLRPIWYDWPEVEDLYIVDDEFMLGPDLLVAPVLNEGQAARDVILPPGDWVNAWTGKPCKGFLNIHPTPCPGIGVFVRNGNENLFENLHEKLREIARGSVRSGVTTTNYEAGLDREISVTG